MCLSSLVALLNFHLLSPAFWICYKVVSLFGWLWYVAFWLFPELPKSIVPVFNFGKLLATVSSNMSPSCFICCGYTILECSPLSDIDPLYFSWLLLVHLWKVATTECLPRSLVLLLFESSLLFRLQRGSSSLFLYLLYCHDEHLCACLSVGSSSTEIH